MDEKLSKANKFFKNEFYGLLYEYEWVIVPSKKDLNCDLEIYFPQGNRSPLKLIVTTSQILIPESNKHTNDKWIDIRKNSANRKYLWWCIRDSYEEEECLLRPLPCRYQHLGCSVIIGPPDKREVHELYLCPKRPGN